MEDGELNSLIEGLGPVVLTQQNHYVVSNTYISTDTPFPTPSPSPSILLRSPAAHTPASPGQARSPVPSPARPNTPQPTLVNTQYSTGNQLVQLIPTSQGNALVGRTQIIQAAGIKAKQPPQILPKPLPPGSAAAKQPVPRISQQPQQLLINQQQQQPQLLFNQVLGHGTPMLVHGAAGGGGVHLMVRPPAPASHKMVLGSNIQQQLLFQQNRHQVVRLMTAQGPMQMQLQQIQTPQGPQYIAVPANQGLSLPANSVLVQGSTPGTLQLQTAPQQVQIQPLPQPQQSRAKKTMPANAVTKKPKLIKARSDSGTSPHSSSSEMSPSRASPKILTSPPMSMSPALKNATSTLRQVRPTTFTRKQPMEPVRKAAPVNPPPVVFNTVKEEPGPVDNLTATINSVATNIGSPRQSPTQAHPFDDVLAGTENLNLNKRPNLTIFQKSPVGQSAAISTPSPATPPKKSSSKKKVKKEEAKVDLWDLMQSAGIGDEELETGAGEISAESVEITADSELLAQLQGSQALQIPGGLRLAVGEDGRPVLIDGTNLLIPDTDDVTSGDHPVLTPQALATAQNQLTQLLQDHGTITPADQQFLNQIFTVNPQQGLAGLIGASSSSQTQNVSSVSQQIQTPVQGQNTAAVNSATQATSVHSVTPTATIQHFPQPTASVSLHSSPQVQNVQPMQSFTVQPSSVQTVQSSRSSVLVSTGTSPPPQQTQPPMLPPEPLAPDSLVITNNNGVPTLVASPALLEYLQTHQGTIQFQQDPITKNIQTSLIIHGPQPRPIAPKSPRLQNVTIKDMGGGTVASSKPALESGLSSITNIFRNQNVPPNFKQSMARLIQENPSLMQMARDTSALITHKETSTMTEAELAEVDRKIQNNKNLLAQCFQMEVEKTGEAAGKENVVFVSGAHAQQELSHLDMNMIKAFHGAPSTNSPTTNSEFQNKFIEAIGMNSPTPVTVLTSKPTTPVQASPVQTTPTPPTPTKKSRSKKKVEKVEPPAPAPQPAKKMAPPTGNYTFSIKQLTAEQNERLNIALAARGVTANRAHMTELTDQEKEMIEEEIGRVTGGSLGNATVKFSPPNLRPPNQQQHEQQQQQTQQQQQHQQEQHQANHSRVTSDEDTDHQQSTIVLNNPNLNQLLDSGVGGGQLVQVGNQVLSLPSAPPPGSVIVGGNGQVLAFVQQPPQRQQPAVPTIQLTAQKQQMLKSVQMQIQAITSRPTRTAADANSLDKLIVEQQKILQSGKLINPGGQQLQFINPSGSQGRIIVKSAQAVSTGTSTSDMSGFGTQPQLVKQASPMVVVADKHVTKCEKGTSPIQIQMGTQTSAAPDFRSVKLSTGTMTSPNTGKPQAVVAPAVMHVAPEPQQMAPPAATQQQQQQPMIKLQRRCPSPVVTVSKTVLIEKQMLADQAGACRPDTDTPFVSKSDAVKRLLRYHVMEDRGLSQQDLNAADDMFSASAGHLLDKFRVMKDKYKYLLLLDSTREVSTAERIMVDRNFIIEERMELEDLKLREEREQEMFLNPPPPPPPQPPPIMLPSDIKVENQDPDLLEPCDIASLPAVLPNLPILKQEDSLTAAALMELEETLESDSDSMSSFGADLPPESINTDSQPDSADISAQVQSAIASILNLGPSGEDEESRKRKRVKGGTEGTKGKKWRREGGPTEETADPGLEEAVRSILS